MAYKTRQRDAIWTVIEASEQPLTAHEICRQAGQQVESLGIATVYRTVKQLTDEGQVRHIELPGTQPHYESAARHHHHFFVCEKCRGLFHLIGCLRGLPSLLPEGFQMARHEIVIYGACQSCT